MTDSPVSQIPEHIFRAYDIRGRVEDELTEDVVQHIGQAFANVARRKGAAVVLVAGDVRLSTGPLKNALARGLNLGGIDAIDIGVVPTPVLYFAVEHFGTGSGIVVTGSHNPPEFNGLKFVLNGVSFAGEQLQTLRTNIAAGKLQAGDGTYAKTSVVEDYIERVCSDIRVGRKLRIGMDCGNGVTGVLAPKLFEAIGCEVHPLYAEPDGTFPNHHPDPIKPENLEDLIGLVCTRNLDLGIGFDGDGDRLGVVSSTGKIVTADTLMAIYAKEILQAQPNAPIVFDVKCGSVLPSTISSHGGQPVMWKTGHTNIKQKIRELNAPLGGEFSGHICFADRWFGFDDAFYAAARLIELLSKSPTTLDEIIGEFPPRFATPELEIRTTDTRKFDVIDQLQDVASFDGQVLTVDGLRVDFDDSWGLIRASNTTPNLTLRFEANSEEALERVRLRFRDQISQVAPDLAGQIDP